MFFLLFFLAFLLPFGWACRMHMREHQIVHATLVHACRDAPPFVIIFESKSPLINEFCNPCVFGNQKQQKTAQKAAKTQKSNRKSSRIAAKSSKKQPKTAPKRREVLERCLPALGRCLPALGRCMHKCTCVSICLHARAHACRNVQKPMGF